MSCNLPVITSMYGGLDKILEPGKGLYFINNEDEIKGVVSEIKQARSNINTREKIMSLSWNTIALAISKVYDSTNTINR